MYSSNIWQMRYIQSFYKKQIALKFFKEIDMKNAFVYINRKFYCISTMQISDLI